MNYLLFTSIIWAFSFGLIKGGLEGIPSPVITALRLAIAFIFFLPFFRPGMIPRRLFPKLLLTGAIQYGMMYLFYIEAYRYLKAYEIALFTVFTPFFVTIINDLCERKLNLPAFGNCLLAVIGGVIIQFRQLSSDNLQTGFILVQISNVCFAFGQIYYRRIMASDGPVPYDLQVYAVPYLGGTITAIILAAKVELATVSISMMQFAILLYLGAIAAGLGFFLWNKGARQVSPGSLAVFNNLKIPLGIMVSVLFFGEKPDWIELFSGGALMLLALFLNEKCNFPRNEAHSSHPEGHKESTANHEIETSEAC